MGAGGKHREPGGRTGSPADGSSGALMAPPRTGPPPAKITPRDREPIRGGGHASAPGAGKPAPHDPLATFR